MRICKPIFVLALSFSLFISASTIAQNKIDSLRQLLSTSSDTTRVKVLNGLAFELLFSEPAESEKLAHESIKIAEDIGYALGLINGYQRLGSSFEIRGEYPQAIEALNTGVKEVETLNSKSKAVQGALMSLLNERGLTYHYQSKYAEAVADYLKAVQIAESFEQFTAKLAHLYNNIGNVYLEQKDYDRALEYYFKALSHAKQTGSTYMVANASNNIGAIYDTKGNHTEAIRFYNQALAGNKAIGNDNDLGANYHNIAVMYRVLNQVNKALVYLDSAETILKKTNNETYLLNVDATRITIYIQQKKFKEAEAFIASDLQLAKKIGKLQNTISLYDNAHELKSAEGDYKAALEWFKKKTKLEDSIFNETNSKQIEELQAKYELDKKEHAIASLEKEKEFRQIIYFISTVALSIIIIGGAAFFIYKLRKDKKLFEAKQALARLREDELKKEIEYKNRELASYTVNFIQKSELMEDMKEMLNELKVESTNDVSHKIKNIQRVIDSNYHIDKEWDNFKTRFEKVHPAFFEQLKEYYPDLTQSDLKLCALLKLGMSIKESARILGIAPDSVKTARYRLRKKLHINNKNEALFDFLQRVEHDVEEIS